MNFIDQYFGQTMPFQPNPPEQLVSLSKFFVYYSLFEQLDISGNSCSLSYWIVKPPPPSTPTSTSLCRKTPIGWGQFNFFLLVYQLREC